MLFALLQFVVLAGIIVMAGVFLARFADEIAELTGFGRLLVGSVLLAGATSLPELTVDLSAVRLGMPDLAVGDLLGSSLMNLLILAILDLTQQSKGQLLSRAASGHALAATLSITLTSIVCLALLTAEQGDSWIFANIHVATWVVALGYAAGIRLVFLDQLLARNRLADDLRHPPRQPRKRIWNASAGFAAAALVILFVGPQLARAAGELAEMSGLGDTFVGTTLVAFTTSLPEFVSSIAALRMGALDLAIGNVFGSNAFNMLVFVPLDALQSGSIYAAVAPTHAISGVCGILATSLVVIGQLYQVGERRRFIEPDAFMVILVIGAALFIIYQAG